MRTRRGKIVARRCPQDVIWSVYNTSNKFCKDINKCRILWRRPFVCTYHSTRSLQRLMGKCWFYVVHGQINGGKKSPPPPRRGKAHLVHTTRSRPSKGGNGKTIIPHFCPKKGRQTSFVASASYRKDNWREKLSLTVPCGNEAKGRGLFRYIRPDYVCEQNCMIFFRCLIL